MLRVTEECLFASEGDVHQDVADAARKALITGKEVQQMRLCREPDTRLCCVKTRIPNHKPNPAWCIYDSLGNAICSPFSPVPV